MLCRRWRERTLRIAFISWLNLDELHVCVALDEIDVFLESRAKLYGVFREEAITDSRGFPMAVSLVDSL